MGKSEIKSPVSLAARTKTCDLALSITYPFGSAGHEAWWEAPAFHWTSVYKQFHVLKWGKSMYTVTKLASHLLISILLFYSDLWAGYMVTWNKEHVSQPPLQLSVSLCSDHWELSRNIIGSVLKGKKDDPLSFPLLLARCRGNGWSPALLHHELEAPCWGQRSKRQKESGSLEL